MLKYCKPIYMVRRFIRFIYDDHIMVVMMMSGSPVCFWLPLQGWPHCMQLKVVAGMFAALLPMMILTVRWPEGLVRPSSALLVTT
jgi:hypothetical protein